MGYGFKAAAGGGSNLNFSVKVYTTEETLLSAAPKENTIGVVTDTAVPKWGFYAAKPETPAEGELCFPIGTESSYAFNALKKNALTVYPMNCQQYISGVWARKTAYIYKDGVWVQFSSDWDGTLYDSGDEYEYITGGWASQKFATNVSGTGTMSKDDTCITLTAQNSASISAYTVNKIDLTDYSTLYVRIISLNKTGSWRFQARIIDGLSASDYESYIGYVDIGSGAGTYSIDISKITGEHYISVDEWCADSFSYVMKFDKVWLE